MRYRGHSGRRNALFARARSLTLLLALAASTAAPARAADKNPILGIDVDKHGEGRVVRIRTVGPPTFTVFRLSDPMRVVVDVSGGDVSQLSGPITVQDGVVEEVASRQFSAEGFYIGRIIIGFSRELPYDVQAQGNAVVVSTGSAINTSVAHAAPPAAPVDRAAAERLEAARREAEKAAAQARNEREAAEAARTAAANKEEQAQRVAKEAERLAQEAERAKRDAEALRTQAKESAASEQARAQEALAQAEERLESAQQAANKVASERALAERLAAQAERTRREAEQAAAEAEARHKEQVAEVEERIAAAQKEKRAAEEAHARAARAKAEAEAAQKVAAAARAETEKARLATDKRLKEIAGRERSLEAERQKLQQENLRLAQERQRQDADRQAMQAQAKSLEVERARLAALAKKQRADKQQVEEAQKAVEAERQRLAAHAKEEQKSERKLAEERARRLAAEKEVKEKERKLAKEKELKEKELRKKEQELAAEKKRRIAAQKERQAALAEQAKKPLPAAALVEPEKKEVAVASLSPVPELARAKPAHFYGVQTRGRGDNAVVHLKLDRAPQYEIQRLDNPPRLVVDLLDAESNIKRYTFSSSSKWVNKIRTGDHGSTLRAVFDLTDTTVEPEINAGDDGLHVAFRRVTAAAPQEVRSRDSTADAPVPASTAADANVQVRDVRFSKSGKVARVVVALSGSTTALVDDRSSKSWVLQLRDAHIGKELERSLDTTAYATAVRLVSSYQASTDPPVVNIVASLAAPAKQVLHQEGDTLVWEIEGEAPRAPTSATPETAGYASTTVATTLARSTPAQQAHGRRVNMRLKDADLVNVIRFIADLTGENIIVSEDVKGKVTVNLRNVPWQQALDTILKSRGYDMVRKNNIIRIATAEQIQKEKEQELAKKRAQLEVEETIIRMIAVNYAVASDIADQIKPSLTSRGSVQVDIRTNTLIVEDLADNMERLIELIQKLDRQTPQVLIEARIVEASSNYEQELGIQWGGTGQATAATGNPTGLLFPGDVIVSGASDEARNNPTLGTGNPGRFAVNMPAPIGGGVGSGLGFIFGSAGGSQILNLRLTALERNGSGRIVSSPRVTTLDNRTAKISQGVDIPVSVVSAAGTNTRFIPANLELEVTPHITNDGSVMMKVKASKNEPDFANRGAGGDPTIVKKQAETEVMVKDGDTAVIGGIYTRNTSENFAEVPFFSKIPVLGWLFKKRRNEDRRAELLIFITPRIVNRQESLLQPGATVQTQAPPTEP